MSWFTGGSDARRNHFCFRTHDLKKPSRWSPSCAPRAPAGQTSPQPCTLCSAPCCHIPRGPTFQLPVPHPRGPEVCGPGTVCHPDTCTISGQLWTPRRHPENIGVNERRPREAVKQQHDFHFACEDRVTPRRHQTARDKQETGRLPTPGRTGTAWPGGPGTHHRQNSCTAAPPCAGPGASPASSAC